MCLARSRGTAPLPNALERSDQLLQRLGSRGERLVLFLDYDGTLADIVEVPSEATISSEVREVLRRTAAALPTGIVSGRSCATLRGFLAGVDGLYLAGSHGMDICCPHGTEGMRHEVAMRARPVLEEAKARLAAAVGHVPGYLTEDNVMCVSAHYRMVPPAQRQAVHDAAAAVVEAAGGQLLCKPGKLVHEIRPAVEWDKGRAAQWLLSVFAAAAPAASDGSAPRLQPIFIGDDAADEDGFRFVERAGGIGLKVGARGLTAADTAASFQLDAPEQVAGLLDALLAAAAPDR